MVNNILSELQERNKSLLEEVELLEKQLAENEQTIKQLEEKPKQKIWHFATCWKVETVMAPLMMRRWEYRGLVKKKWRS